jgi:hypothetical protein
MFAQQGLDGRDRSVGEVVGGRQVEAGDETDHPVTHRHHDERVRRVVAKLVRERGQDVRRAAKAYGIHDPTLVSERAAVTARVGVLWTAVRQVEACG